MNLNSIYGIICNENEEKNILKEISNIFKKKLSKSKNKIFLEGYKPFNYDYIYFNFTKSDATYISLIPNKDKNGKYNYPDHPEYGWLLITRIRDDFNHLNPEQIAADTKELVYKLDLKVELVENPD